MILRSLKITNYRNLDGVTIDLCDDINFFVGENNLGKSNLTHYISNVINVKRFVESNFMIQTIILEWILN